MYQLREEMRKSVGTDLRVVNYAGGSLTLVISAIIGPAGR